MIICPFRRRGLSEVSEVLLTKMAQVCRSTGSTLSQCCPRLGEVCDVRFGLTAMAEHWAFVASAYFLCVSSVGASACV